MPFVEDSIERGSVIHTDGWLGYLPPEGKGVPARGHLPQGEQPNCIRADAAPSSCGRTA